MFKNVLFSCLLAGTYSVTALASTVNGFELASCDIADNSSVIVDINSDQSIKESNIIINYSVNYSYDSRADKKDDKNVFVSQSSSSAMRSFVFSNLDELNDICRNFYKGISSIAKDNIKISIKVNTSLSKDEIASVLSQYFNTDSVKITNIDNNKPQECRLKQFLGSKHKNKEKHCGFPFAQRVNHTESNKNDELSQDQMKQYWKQLAKHLAPALERMLNTSATPKKPSYAVPNKGVSYDNANTDVTIKHTRNASPNIDLVWEAENIPNDENTLIMRKSLEHIVSMYINDRVSCDLRDGNLVIHVDLNNPRDGKFFEDTILRVISKLVTNGGFNEALIQDIARNLQIEGINLSRASVNSVNSIFNAVFKNEPSEIVVTLPKGRR